MTEIELIDDLQTDNQHLYFLLGALTDAFEQLPEFSQAQMLKALRDKQSRVTGDKAHKLAAFIESLTCNDSGTDSTRGGQIR